MAEREAEHTDLSVHSGIIFSLFHVKHGIFNDFYFHSLTISTSDQRFHCWKPMNEFSQIKHQHKRSVSLWNVRLQEGWSK